MKANHILLSSIAERKRKRIRTKKESQDSIIRKLERAVLLTKKAEELNNIIDENIDKPPISLKSSILPCLYGCFVSIV